MSQIRLLLLKTTQIIFVYKHQKFRKIFIEIIYENAAITNTQCNVGKFKHVKNVHEVAIGTFYEVALGGEFIEADEKEENFSKSNNIKKKKKIFIQKKTIFKKMELKKSTEIKYLILKKFI